jgi:hypothetical protein
MITNLRSRHTKASVRNRPGLVRRGFVRQDGCKVRAFSDDDRGDHRTAVREVFPVGVSKRLSGGCLVFSLAAGTTVLGAFASPALAGTPTTVTKSTTVTIPAGGYANDPVVCPTGTVAVGGGGTAAGGVVTSDGPMLDGKYLAFVSDGNYGNAALTGWNVSAAANSSSSGSLTATAVCATLGGSLPPALTVKVMGTNVASAQPAVLDNYCDASGEAIGGGADDNDSLSVDVVASYPAIGTGGANLTTFPSGSGPAPMGWETRFYNGATSTVTVKAAVICAQMTGYGTLYTVLINNALTTSAHVDCGSGQEVLDGGGANSANDAKTSLTPTGMSAGSPGTGWSVAGMSAPIAAAAVCLTPLVPHITVSRLSGSDRIGTAIAISANSFPVAGSAKGVVLARSDQGQFADALVGAALAGAKKGPLLLTPSSTLDPRTLAEIQRVLPAGGTVFALGGTAALSAGVASSLTAAGFTVTRYGGTDRFATAAIVADQGLGDPMTVFEATGLNFPDALAAGAAAAHMGGAVLLTNGSSQAPETAAYLAAHPAPALYAVGGQAVTADPSAVPVFGANRYATATQVALTFFTSPTTFGAALGTNYPDALAGAPAIGSKGGPLLLVAGSGPLPSDTANYLADHTTLTGGFLYGGTSAVGDDVLNELDVSVP